METKRAVKQIELANEQIKLTQRNRTENKAVRKTAHFLTSELG